MDPALESVQSGWLKKVKGDGAVSRWFSSAQWRFYTLDFKTKLLSAWRSEAQQKAVAPAMRFADIVSAELLRGGGPTTSLVLRTRNSVCTLYTPDEAQAAKWVWALNLAIEQAKVGAVAAGLPSPLATAPAAAAPGPHGFQAASALGGVGGCRAGLAPFNQPQLGHVSRSRGITDPRPARRGARVDVIGFGQPGGDAPQACDLAFGCAFLSTFCDVRPGAITLSAPHTPDVQRSFRNAEAAFQALKVWKRAQFFQEAAAAEAVSLKHAWRAEEDLRLGGYNSSWAAMLAVQRAKFAPDTPAAEALKQTGDSFLLAHCAAEGRDNTWSDNNNGEGLNLLGMTLMLVRDELAAPSIGRSMDSWTAFISRDCSVNLATGKFASPAGESHWRGAVHQAAAVAKDHSAANGTSEALIRAAQQPPRPEPGSLPASALQTTSMASLVRQSMPGSATPGAGAHGVSGVPAADELTAHLGTPRTMHNGMTEEECQAALKLLSCELRSQAAASRADWQRLTWKERYAVVQAMGEQPNSHMSGLRNRYANGAGLAINGSQPQVGFSPRLCPAMEPSRLGATRTADLDFERLRAIFDTNDSLQLLFRNRSEMLMKHVILGMRSSWIPAGEVVAQQGCDGDTMFVVDEGVFDVFVQRADPAAGPMGRRPQRVCQHGPGSVFGEKALVSTLPRTSTVQATTRSRVWTLNRASFQALLRLPDGTKTIGLLGSIMLLANNLAGPTIVSMPALAQEAGWVAFLVVQLVIAAMSCACGLMLIEAMRRMPGNRNFDQRIEFANLTIFYLPQPVDSLVMLCYLANSIMSLMSLIIQSGHCIDYLLLNLHGCAPGVALAPPGLAYVCGASTSSSTPFGDSYVVSCSLVILSLVCAPFAVLNLDDVIVLQYLAIAGLVIMATIWLALLSGEPHFPVPLPAVTSSQGGLIGTVLFNFAFVSTLPSWVNEKRPDVSVKLSFVATCGLVIAIYSAVGIVGGMAYQPFYTSDENLFSKLNASGSKLGQATVIAYPMLQNLTSIPVFSILIRYNFTQSGMPRGLATFLAVVLPWLLSIPFYTGKGFETLSEVGGLATSSVINFVAPALMYLSSRWDSILRWTMHTHGHAQMGTHHLHSY